MQDYILIEDATILIGGDIASGKTTHGRQLVKQFQLPTLYVGGIFRGFAEELGVDFSEFQRIMKEDPDYYWDKKGDQIQLDFMKSHRSYLLDSRLGDYFTELYKDQESSNAIKKNNTIAKIFLACKPRVAAQRLYKAKLEELDALRHVEVEATELDILAAIFERFFSESLRYHRLYGYNLVAARDNYDIVIDTTKITKEETYAQIISFLKEKKLLIPIEELVT